MDVVTLALAKKYADRLFSKVDSVSISFVDELPALPVEKTIYFVPRNESEFDYVYNEYMYIDGGWRQVGSTEMKLEDYYTKNELKEELTNILPYATKSNTGGVKIDGSTITIDENGVISVNFNGSGGSGGQANVQSDWAETNTESDSYIKNKPTKLLYNSDSNLAVVDTTGDDTKNDVTTFTSEDSTTAESWTDVEVLSSGEKHSSLWKKVSIMFKNIRYLKNFLGNNDISSIGDGTVTGGISTLNDNLNKLEPTFDILNDALSIPSSTYKFFRLTGSSYTGDIPIDGAKYGTALVMRRGSSNAYVIIFCSAIYMNIYSSSKWQGWIQI